MSRLIAFLLGLILLQIFSSAQAQENSRSDLGFVEASVDNANPYIGQPIIYRFYFYYAFTPNSETYDWPDFIGFGQEFRPQFLSVATINGVQYTVYQQDIVLYPARTGTFEIEPTIVMLPETPFQRGATMQTRPATVYVRPLPENAPSSFNGAIGQYDMAVRLESTSIKLGDFTILNLSLTGSGNIQQLLAPEFALPPGWQKIAKPSQFQSNLNIPFGGTRTFEWQIIPNKDGIQTVAPIVFSSFNPQIGVYETITGSPLPLEVIPNDTAFDLEARINRPTTIPQVSLPLKPLARNLSGNEVDPASFPFWAWVLPPILASLSGLWAFRQQLSNQNNNKHRRSNAYKNAVTNLIAVQPTHSIQTYKRINHVIVTYFADKLQHPANEIARNDMLQSLSYSDELQSRLKMCFEQIDAGLYSPVGSADNRNLIRFTLDTLKLIDEQWQVP